MRSSHQPCLHVLVPVAIMTLSVTGFNRPAETIGQSDRNSDRGQSLFYRRCRPYRSPPHPPIAVHTGATPHGKMGEICLPKTTEAISARGRVPAVPDLYCRFRRLSPFTGIWRSPPFEGGGCQFPDANLHANGVSGLLAGPSARSPETALQVRLLRQPGPRSLSRAALT